jgi:hypothetical protein
MAGNFLLALLMHSGTFNITILFSLEIILNKLFLSFNTQLLEFFIYLKKKTKPNMIGIK